MFMIFFFCFNVFLKKYYHKTTNQFIYKIMKLINNIYISLLVDFVYLSQLTILVHN